MQGSIERVKAVVNGEMPDRAPLFDLLRNDAVIEHFTGTPLTVENAEEVGPATYEPAIDANLASGDKSGRRTTQNAQARLLSPCEICTMYYMSRVSPCRQGRRR